MFSDDKENMTHSTEKNVRLL